MKKVGIISVLFLILGSGFGKSLIYAFFETNRDYYATYLCVQKEIKDNCCKGSCQLNKQLEEEPANDSSTLPVFSAKDLKECLLHSLLLLDITNRTIEFNTTRFALYVDFMPQAPALAVDSPPKIS